MENDKRLLREQKEKLIPIFTYGAIAHGYQPPRLISLPEGTYQDKKQMDISRPRGNYRSEKFNDQILRECYGPILADTKRGIPEGLVFSYFATLREWLKSDHPDTYRDIKKNIKNLPDKEYQVLGDPFLHIIMPFFQREDQLMLYQMGRKAFEEDNGFLPKGLWLPETAVDKNTLQNAKDAGYEFIMLRDHQLEGVGSGRISKFEASQNPVYQHLPNGGEIAIVHFDSGTSGEIAFNSGKTDRVEDFFNDLSKFLKNEDLLITGVDLETYGHHKKKKEEFLRSSLLAASNNDYNKFLQNQWHQNPVGFNVNLLSLRKQLRQREKTYDNVIDRTSWSCSNGHNLGRWTGGCNCDNPSGEARGDKTRFFNTLSGYNNNINLMLDENFKGWRKDFSEKVLKLRTKIFSGENFLPDLKKMSGERYSLYAAKLYTLIGFTSCGWFFGDTNSIERDLPKDMIAAVEKIFPEINSYHRRAKAS
ncbi:MAG TPA: hypothetical protein VF189_04035 [Patescibacteria group bacterium]